MKSKIGIIILNWNGSADTIECLESLKMSELYDIYLLDNGSEQEDVENIRKYLWSSKYRNCINEVEINQEFNYSKFNFIIAKKNLGFAGGNNAIAMKIFQKYECILLLNNDTVVPENTIHSMYTFLLKKNCISVTCDIRYYYDRSKLWNAGGRFTWYKDRKYYPQRYIDNLKKTNVDFIFADFITGCAMLIDSNYVKKFGLFTDRFFHGEEDYNFCLYAKRRGCKIGVDLTSTLYHKVGGTLKPERDRDRYFNAVTVYYCNRIIDYKLLLEQCEWIRWRRVYIFLIFIKRSMNMGLVRAYALCKRVKTISDAYDSVDKSLFDSIMKGK